MHTHYTKPLWKTELNDSLTGDSTAQQLIVEITISPTVVAGYSLSQGNLLKDGRFNVGKSTDLSDKICTTLHGSPEGGHSGISTTIKRIERTFYWSGM